MWRGRPTLTLPVWELNESSTGEPGPSPPTTPVHKGRRGSYTGLSYAGLDWKNTGRSSDQEEVVRV